MDIDSCTKACWAWDNFVLVENFILLFSLDLWPIELYSGLYKVATILSNSIAHEKKRIFKEINKKPLLLTSSYHIQSQHPNK